MNNLVHRYTLGARFVCGAQIGRGSTTGIGITCPLCQHDSFGPPVYMVKCDECKQIMRYTTIIRESYAGGYCQSCDLRHGTRVS